MSYFNNKGKRVSNLTSGGWMTVLVIAMLVGAGGGFLGFMINDWTSDEPSTMNVTVSAGFGVSIKEGVTVTEPFDSNYKCAGIGMETIKVGWEDYTDIYNYLQAHPTHHFAVDNASVVSGNNWHPFAMTMEFVSEEFFGLFSTPDIDADFDGRSHKFDCGYYVVVVPIIFIYAYIDGTCESLGFTFQSIIDFMLAMNSDGATFAEFSSAQFLKSENSMTINELKFDALDSDDSLLSVVFNGVVMDLPVGAI